MNRPSNWYNMDYSQQREWEDNERKHRRDMENAEYEADRARESAQRDLDAAERRRRELRVERDDLLADLETMDAQIRTVRTDLARALQFIHDMGHDEAFATWKQMVKDHANRT